jgi:hypothetical protein
MKNYKQIKKYENEEWETDNNWLGFRLSFIWNVRKYRNDLFIKNKLNEELTEIYNLNNMQIRKIASNDFNYIDGKKFDNYYKNKSEEEMISDFNELDNLRVNNFELFINKNTYDKYEYLLITLY